MAEPATENPNLRSSLTPTTIDAFITNFTRLELGARFSLPSIPDDEHAQALTQQIEETSILQLPSLEVMIVKGTGRTTTAITRGEQLQLKPKTEIHTHPTQQPKPERLKALLTRAEISEADADIDGLTQLALIMPSPDDFTLGSIGAERNEIWSQYGKTTYQPYTGDTDASLELGLNMLQGLYSGKSFISILADKSLDVQAKIVKLNDLLKYVGVSFQFTPWESKEEQKIHEAS